MEEIAKNYTQSVLDRSQTVPKGEFDHQMAKELFMVLYQKETEDSGIDIRKVTIDSLVKKILVIMTHYNNSLTKHYHYLK